MTRYSRLAQFAQKLWPADHKRYEEMCVLAVTGQLGGSQMCELNEHISHCDSCRNTLDSVTQVTVQAMPLLSSEHCVDVAPPRGIRERFIERLRLQEAIPSDSLWLSNHAAPPKPLILRPKSSDQAEQSKALDADFSRAPGNRFPWRATASLAACAAIACAGYYAGQWRASQATRKVVELSPAVTVPQRGDATTVNTDRVARLERQKSDLEAQLSEFKQKLVSARADEQSLGEQLAAAKVELARLKQAVETSRQSEAEALDTKGQLAIAQAQIIRLNQRMGEADLKLAVQKQTGEDLARRLETTEADLQQERDLKSAKDQMRDLVAARNLHIVDVYDADPNGKRQRSFGRVFYIEGKSLVFYAYDLDSPGHFQTNVAFHVWGGKVGVKDVIHNLGVLRKDDESQSRWAMTFDDSKVLAQINTVFVTAESVSKRNDAPRGKKILYAYFGSLPNHP